MIKKIWGFSFLIGIVSPSIYGGEWKWENDVHSSLSFLESLRLLEMGSQKNLFLRKKKAKKIQRIYSYKDRMFQREWPIDLDINTLKKRDPEKSYQKGMSFLWGLGGVKPNQQKGAQLISYAAFQGHSVSKLYEDVLLFLGIGKFPMSLEDLEIKDDLIKEVSENLNSESFNVLGLFYEFGLGGVSIDQKKAKDFYEKAGDHADALCNLGRILEEEQDLSSALVAYEKSARLGHLEGRILSGRLHYYFSQLPSEKTLRKKGSEYTSMKDLLERAANREYPPAVFDRALAHSSSFKKAASLGYLAAQDFIRQDKLTKKQTIVLENKREKEKQYLDSVERIEEEFHLKEVFSKIQEALHLLEKASKLGSTKSFMKQGEIYEHLGNYQKAFSCYDSAFKMGYEDAWKDRERVKGSLQKKHKISDAVKALKNNHVFEEAPIQKKLTGKKRKKHPKKKKKIEFYSYNSERRRFKKFREKENPEQEPKLL